jgi:hypothetical protein
VPLVERQLELVRARRRRLSEFEDELSKKLRSLREMSWKPNSSSVLPTSRLSPCSRRPASSDPRGR